MVEPIQDLQQYKGQYGTYDLIGISPKMREVHEAIRTSAPTSAAVVIIGESGTGKELVARAIHKLSGRNGLFVPINCGAFTETLLEAQLFGAERGAYTGAVGTRKGFLEVASGGTLFLDEISEMSLKMQVDLLRVLQEHEFYRVGGFTPLKTSARIVAAGSESIENAASEGRFKKPLYYRLAISPIELPSLRERGEDIALLARYFCKVACDEYHKPPLGIDEKALQYLQEEHLWPGNVRELESVVHRTIMRSADAAANRSQGKSPHNILQREDFAKNLRPFNGNKVTLVGVVTDIYRAIQTGQLSYSGAIGLVEAGILRQASRETHGNKRQAAKLVGLSRTTFIDKLKQFGVED